MSNTEVEYVFLDGCSLTPEILYDLSNGKKKIKLSE